MNGSVLFEGNPILSGSLNVNTGGNIEPLEIEINENGRRTITPPSGVDGYAPITIETDVPQIVPVLETLNVTENGSYEPPTGVYGFSNVNVNVPTPPPPVLDTLNITQNGTYTPPSGVDGYDEVNVSVSLPENAYLLEEYEDVPTDIASFEASDAPLKSLTASIVPVQDLHGYDSPWAGGAGKNKCPTPIADNVVYINGEYAVTLAFNNGNITFTTSANISTYFLLKAFTITSDHVGKTFTMSYSATPSLDDAQCILVLNDNGTRTNLDKTATITADMVGKDLTLRFYKYGIGTYIISNIQLEVGSTATSYAPYSNICPISGWSGCKVGNLGSKNWYDTRQSLLAGYLNGDGTAGGTGQSINKHTEKIPIKGGITYTYSVAVSRNADQVCLWYDKNNNVIGGFSLLKNTTSITAQAPINAESVSLTVYNVDGQTIQLEAGSQATAYEPYNPNGTTTTIPFTDSQGNPVEVFGGSVDVVNGIVTPCPYYASYNGEELTGEWLSDRDVYSPNTTPTIGAQVVNIGATGTPFSVQPTSIKSLDGVNNVFASTGDVEELKYFTRATS